jgi:hypothetical protein
MAEQQLSTASYNADLSKVRFDIAWQVASAALKKFGIGSNPPGKLDEDALAKMMVKNKKNLVFVARSSIRRRSRSSPCAAASRRRSWRRR